MYNKLNGINSKDLNARFKLLVTYIISKWYVIILISLFFSGFGYYDGLTNPQKYIATLTFVSENKGADKFSSYSGIASQFGIDLGGSSTGGIFEGDNLNEFFKSKYAITSTLLTPINNNSDTLLLDLYTNNHKLFTGNKEFHVVTIFKNESTTRKMDSLLNSISNKILQYELRADKKDKKSGIVSLEFEDINEEFAKIFIEKLSDFVINYYIEYRTTNASKNLKLLLGQSDSLKNLLNNSITGEAQNLDFNVNPNRQILKIKSSKSRIDITANSNMYSEVLKQLALAKISLLKETPLIQVIDKPIMPLAKVGFGKVKKILIFFTIGFFLTTFLFSVRFSFKNFSE